MSLPVAFFGADPPGQVLRWLRESDSAILRTLWSRADEARREHVGDEVHLRGLIEISNHCVRGCSYCGLREARRGLVRYRMTHDEVLACARSAGARGYGSVVLQAGEDDGLRRDEVAALVRHIKDDTGLAVTLSLGERDDDDWAAWRAAGADRYLLRFETSDDVLFRRIHPPRAGRAGCRLDMLRRLRSLGYEIGSGVMVGIPGQTWESLARDIILFAQLDLDMIGVGPFLPHPATPLGRASRVGGPEQVPNSEHIVYRVLALARLACPEANIPSTTALATLSRTRGRELGLARGANVIMPNLTPSPYRQAYEIYPGKACANETAGAESETLVAQLAAMGRRPGIGTGARRRC